MEEQTAELTARLVEREKELACRDDELASYRQQVAQLSTTDQTVRQLEEVWQIKAGPTAAGAILTGLKSALAGRATGFVRLDAGELQFLEEPYQPHAVLGHT